MERERPCKKPFSCCRRRLESVRYWKKIQKSILFRVLKPKRSQGTVAPSSRHQIQDIWSADLLIDKGADLALLKNRQSWIICQPVSKRSGRAVFDCGTHDQTLEWPIWDAFVYRKRRLTSLSGFEKMLELGWYLSERMMWWDFVANYFKWTKSIAILLLENKRNKR